MSTVGSYRGPNIVTRGLVLHLDAASPNSYYSPNGGTVWKDVSGNGNDVTLLNTPLHTGNAFNLDGTNSRARGGLSSFNWGNALSVFVWLKNEGGDYRGVVNTGYYTNGNWEIRFGREDFFGGTNNGTRLGCFVNTVDGFLLLSMNAELNEVGHYGFVYNGQELVLYANASAQTSGSLTGNITSLENNLGIGSRHDGGGGQMFNSDIYTIQIHNRALSAQEVLQNYNATKDRFGL